MRILHNSIVGGGIDFEGGALPSDRWAGPGATVTLAGNLSELEMPCAQQTGTWTWNHNAWSNARCPGDSAEARPAFLAASPPVYDLHLSRESPGLGTGPVAMTATFDIDGHRRPIGVPSDAGASQRETSAIRAGVSIGAVSLGEPQTAVVAFYGNPANVRTARAGPALESVQVATYRVHRGRLDVMYDAGGAVVRVSTTSPYYGAPNVASVGASWPHRVRRGAVLGPCAQTVRAGGARTLFYRVSTRARVTAVTVTRAQYAPCSNGT
jgi:hypothetical protein